MGNFLINQKIKKIKEFDSFDSFDSLINWDDVHTSYLNKGQCSTEKHLWKKNIIYTNGYNSITVMAGLKKQKNKSKNQILWLFLIIWLILGFGRVGGWVHNYYLPEMFFSWTLTFVEVGCMYIISINQRIKRIKLFDFFDYFDFLIN